MTVNGRMESREGERRTRAGSWCCHHPACPLGLSLTCPLGGGACRCWSGGAGCCCGCGGARACPPCPSQKTCPCHCHGQHAGKGGRDSTSAPRPTTARQDHTCLSSAPPVAVAGAWCWRWCWCGGGHACEDDLEGEAVAHLIQLAALGSASSPSPTSDHSDLRT